MTQEEINQTLQQATDGWFEARKEINLNTLSRRICRPSSNLA